MFNVGSSLTIQACVQCLLSSFQPFHVRGERQVAQFIIPGGAGDHSAHVQCPIPAPVSLPVPTRLHCRQQATLPSVQGAKYYRGLCNVIQCRFFWRVKSDIPISFRNSSAWLRGGIASSIHLLWKITVLAKILLHVHVYIYMLYYSLVNYGYLCCFSGSDSAISRGPEPLYGQW